jgi:hypothetical protein
MQSQQTVSHMQGLWKQSEQGAQVQHTSQLSQVSHQPIPRISRQPWLITQPPQNGSMNHLS